MIDLRHRFPAITEGTYRRHGPVSTGRPARRWSTQRSRRHRRGSGAGTTPTATVRSPRPQACDDLDRPAEATRWASCSTPTRTGSWSGRRPRPTCSRSPGPSHATCSPVTRSSARTLDHDSNVSPWLLIAEDTGATVRVRRVRPADRASAGRRGRRPAQRSHQMGRRHRRQQRDRHDARRHCDHRGRPRRRRQGRRRRRAPHAARPGRHRRDRVRRLLHELVQVVRTTCRHHLDRARTARHTARRTRCDPAPSTGAERFQHGTPAYENLAAIEAAAEFLLDTGMSTRSKRTSGRCSAACSTACSPTTGSPSTARTTSTIGRRRWRSTSPATRPRPSPRPSPPNRSRCGTATTTRSKRWASLGVESAVRAGIAVYVTDDDVDRLVTAVAAL